MDTHEPLGPTSPTTPERRDTADTGTTRRTVKTPRSRAASAWVGAAIAALLLTGLIVFMLQNTQPVLVTFLSMEATVSLAIALLIAGVGVGIVALVIGTIRIGQLKRQLVTAQRGQPQ